MPLSIVFLIIFLGLYAVKTFIPERVLDILCAVAAILTAIFMGLSK